MTTSSRRQRRRSPRPAQQRRQDRKRGGEVIDFMKDYEYVRGDLKRIAVWSSLLFVCMIGVYIFL